MRGRDAIAVPSTTSTTTSPSNLGASCAACPLLAAMQTPSPWRSLNSMAHLKEDNKGDAGNLVSQGQITMNPCMPCSCCVMIYSA